MRCLVWSVVVIAVLLGRGEASAEEDEGRSNPLKGPLIAMGIGGAGIAGGVALMATYDGMEDVGQGIMGFVLAFVGGISFICGSALAIEVWVSGSKAEAEDEHDVDEARGRRSLSLVPYAAPTRSGDLDCGLALVGRF